MAWLLKYLAQRAKVEVLNEQVFFDGAFEAEFLYQGSRFVIDCPISSPLLSAEGECSESTFAELLAHIKDCPERDPWLWKLLPD